MHIFKKITLLTVIGLNASLGAQEGAVVPSAAAATTSTIGSYLSSAVDKCDIKITINPVKSTYSFGKFCWNHKEIIGAAIVGGLAVKGYYYLSNTNERQLDRYRQILEGVCWDANHKIGESHELVVKELAERCRGYYLISSQDSTLIDLVNQFYAEYNRLPGSRVLVIKDAKEKIMRHMYGSIRNAMLNLTEKR